MLKRKFYEIELDNGKASPTSNRVTKRAKLVNSSDSKFKNMKKTRRYIDKLTDLNAKKNVIEEEDKNSISDVEERSVIKNKEQPKQQIKKLKKILRRKKSIQSLNDLKKREKNLNFIYIWSVWRSSNTGRWKLHVSCISIRRVWLWKLLSIDKRDDLRLYTYKFWKVYTFYYWWRSWQLSYRQKEK